MPNIENMDGAEIMGRTLKVNIAKPSKIANVVQGKALWDDENWIQENMKDNDGKELETTA